MRPRELLRKILTLSSSTIVSRKTSCSVTRRSVCAQQVAPKKFVSDSDNTYGGEVITNPSGGLLSKGHPLGATGLAQCTELVQQLRGTAGRRQVEGARLALQHNLGFGRRLRGDALRARLKQGCPDDRSKMDWPQLKGQLTLTDQVRLQLRDAVLRDFIPLFQ